jgi:hypothetical protein
MSADPKPNTAVAVISPTGHTLPAWMGGITAALPEALAAGKVIIDSGFGPKDCKGPAAIVVAVAMGARLGLDPFTAIHGIAVVNGRPSLFGDALLAVCQNHPGWDDFVEEWTGKKYDDDFTAHCTVMRKNRKPKTETFSVADAKKAGLWGKQGPWSAQPQRMMMMRARAFALRGAFGDALAGFHSREEMEDVEPREVEATVRSEPRPAKARTIDAAPAETEPAQVSAQAAAVPAATETGDQAGTAAEGKTLGKHVADAQAKDAAPAKRDTSVDACIKAYQGLWNGPGECRTKAKAIRAAWNLGQIADLAGAGDDDREAFLIEVENAQKDGGK